VGDVLPTWRPVVRVSHGDDLVITQLFLAHLRARQASSVLVRRPLL
jgi:hypothetical protein